MTSDYNDGKWHGWNGGECPVHPKTKVQAVCIERDDGDSSFTSPHKIASDLNWSAENAFPIISFRVIEEYREPREWWIVPRSPQFMAEYNDDVKPFIGAIRVREVLEDE